MVAFTLRKWMDMMAGEGHSLQNDTLPSSVSGAREANPLHPTRKLISSQQNYKRLSLCCMTLQITQNRVQAVILDLRDHKRVIPFNQFFPYAQTIAGHH